MLRLLPVTLLTVALAACGSDRVSRELGASCSGPDDCEKLCLPPSDDAPGGFCTRQCVTHDDCPSDAACVAEGGGVCLFACRDDRDCDFLGAEQGRAWTCHDETAQEGGTVRVCSGT